MAESNKKKKIPYSLRVGKSMNQKLTRHIPILQVTDSKFFNMHKWIENAIEEKMRKEKDNPESDIDLQTKSISLKINEHIYKKLTKKIDSLKSIHGSYSKKTWLVEAIQEKLASESKEVAKKLKQISRDY